MLNQELPSIENLRKTYSFERAPPPRRDVQSVVAEVP